MRMGRKLSIQDDDAAALRWRRLGRLVSMARVDRGMTQTQLAKHIHVTNTYVSKIENGLVPTSTPTIELCAQVLHADMSDLLRVAGKLPTGLTENLTEMPSLHHLLCKVASCDESQCSEIEAKIKELMEAL